MHRRAQRIECTHIIKQRTHIAHARARGRIRLCSLCQYVAQATHRVKLRRRGTQRRVRRASVAGRATLELRKLLLVHARGLEPR